MTISELIERLEKAARRNPEEGNMHVAIDCRKCAHVNDYPDAEDTSVVRDTGQTEENIFLITDR